MISKKEKIKMKILKSFASGMIGVFVISLFFIGVSCNKKNPVTSNRSGTVTDADGNVYQTVRIGNQVWTVENLKTTKYNDGTAIANETEPGVSGGTNGWQNLTTGAYCYYNNDAANGAHYGALYNWYAVNTGKLAPEGWRIPTNAEWDTLENYLMANGYNYNPAVTGIEIAKAVAAKTDWTASTNIGAIGNDLGTNNRSGFSALPGGVRFTYGSFELQSLDGLWWSATEMDTAYALGYAWGYGLVYNGSTMGNAGYDKRNGYSVRLVRDSN
jgi:uncharacterized protein (TIGR02145 family)